MLCNLLENAAKYSPADLPIIVGAEQRAGEVAISIADEGAGIEPAEQDLIFDKFYRGQGQRYRVSGTGMGLAICRAIVEAHRGIEYRDQSVRVRLRVYIHFADHTKQFITTSIL